MIASNWSLQLRHPGAQAWARRVWLISTCTFIPRNVGITASNYQRTDFYADLTSFIRADLPKSTLDTLDMEQNVDSLLHQVRLGLLS